jgi:hypothetical protein
MGVSDEAKNVIPLKFLRKIKNNFFFPLVNSIRGHTVYTRVFTSNNGPNNALMQPNKHISQTSRYQLIFLFFNESKTAFIKTIFSCRYVTSIKPKMYNWLRYNVCKVHYYS